MASTLVHSSSEAPGWEAPPLKAPKSTPEDCRSGKGAMPLVGARETPGSNKSVAPGRRRLRGGRDRPRVHSRRAPRTAGNPSPHGCGARPLIRAMPVILVHPTVTPQPSVMVIDQVAHIPTKGQVPAPEPGLRHVRAQFWTRWPAPVDLADRARGALPDARVAAGHASRAVGQLSDSFKRVAISVGDSARPAARSRRSALTSGIFSSTAAAAQLAS